VQLWFDYFSQATLVTNIVELSSSLLVLLIFKFGCACSGLWEGIKL